MKKRVLAIILTMVMCLGLVSVSTSAASSFEGKYFPNGKISTPFAAYLKHISDGNNDEIKMWYNLPKELMTLSLDYNTATEADKSVEEAFGVNSYDLSIQTDVKIDNGSWQYTNEWDSSDWSGFEELSNYAFACYNTINQDTNKLYNNMTLSWLTYIENENTGFLAPILTTSQNEYDELCYHYDLSGHTLAVRYRLAVKYVAEYGEEPVMIFSDWSPETSIGADSNQKVLEQPSTLEAPKLSDFSITVNSEGKKCAEYYLDVPNSIYDVLLYCEGERDMFEPMHIQAQMRINGGEWADVYTANPTSIFSNFRSAAPDNAVLSENDSVEIRAKFEVSELGLVSDWSNIVGTKAQIIASDWAKGEIEKAEKLGLIPDSLNGEDLTKSITRAEFAAVSVKVYAALSGENALANTENPFSDTSDTEVLKAYNLGITKGISDTTFEPNTLLNREQAATMLTRTFKRASMSGWTIGTDSDFPLSYEKPAAFADDTKISDWAKDSVYFMVANGIINGVGDNKFAPQNTTTEEEALGYANATREQALAIAVRMVEKLK